jgi:threonyl-tRNA synthetase
LTAGIEEAKKRDHRNVGVQQDLFFFHHLSPGSAFFLPNGGRIYNTLIDLMREKYWEYEYDEVRDAQGCVIDYVIGGLNYV